MKNMVACVLLDSDDEKYMSGHKNIKINNIVGCVLYCKNLVDDDVGDVGGVGGGVGGVGVCVCSSYFYLLGIDKSDKDIINSLVDDSSNLFSVSFNSNKIGNIMVKKGV